MLIYLNLLDELDQALSRLGKSDSSVEYAYHIRDEFDGVVDKLNEVKKVLGGSLKSSDDYFI